MQVPINQEDMAVTLLAFSYNVLVGVEAIRGAELPSGEQEAFLHLWRYMGHLMGVAEEHNPCAGATPSRNKGPPLQPCFCAPHVVSLTTPQRPPPPRLLARSLAGGMAHAKASLESIILHLLHPDATSVKVRTPTTRWATASVAGLTSV